MIATSTHMNKQEILLHIRDVLRRKQEELQHQINDLADGIANDTKSSAGDKYETARSMSQQEMDKLSVQLQEVQRQTARIPQLEAVIQTENVVSGALVETDNGLFYLGLPLGMLTICDRSVFCISPSAPLAAAMLGKKSQEIVTFNGRSIKILEVN